MFNLLKEKLKSWLGKTESKTEEVKEKPRKKEKTAKAPKEKASLNKKEKTPSDKELKQISEKIKEEVPQKFETGQLQYQPDVEKIQEKITKEKIKIKKEVQAEKKGFFSKLFSKKEKPEEIKEKILEKLPAEKKEEQKGFFSKLSAKFTTSTIAKEQVEDIFQDLEIILLENNVALEVVDKIKENLIKDLVGVEVKKTKIEETTINSLKSSIEEVLIEPPNLIEQIKKSLEPYTIIFFGINGTGKTTSIAKVAHLLQKNNISVILAAADTFRAAAIEQLETHAQKLKIPIIKSRYNSDPTSVAFEAKKYAQAHKIKAVLIDTAGRMHTKENLINQMEKIIRVIKPNLKLFVGESITGNDAIEQAKTFNEAAGIDGIILSKADVDEKGGTALSVSYVTKKPIYFLGTGQSYEDLTPFKKEIILKNLGLD